MSFGYKSRAAADSQFPSTGPVPARVFSETAVGVDLSLDTAQISQNISLNVTNTSGSTVIFNAATSDITTKSDYYVRTSYTLWQVTVPIASAYANPG